MVEFWLLWVFRLLFVSLTLSLTRLTSYVAIVVFQLLAHRKRLGEHRLALLICRQALQRRGALYLR